jgi:hypothetical protein
MDGAANGFALGAACPTIGLARAEFTQPTSSAFYPDDRH